MDFKNKDNTYAVNKFEEKIGIYTPPQDSTKIDTFTIEIEDENR